MICLFLGLSRISFALLFPTKWERAICKPNLFTIPSFVFGNSLQFSSFTWSVWDEYTTGRDSGNTSISGVVQFELVGIWLGSLFGVEVGLGLLIGLLLGVELGGTGVSFGCGLGGGGGGDMVLAVVGLVLFRLLRQQVSNWYEYETSWGYTNMYKNSPPFINWDFSSGIVLSPIILFNAQVNACIIYALFLCSPGSM